MAITSYSGTEKAAILMLAFGEEIAGDLFKYLDEYEIKRVGSAMSRLGRLEEEDVDEIMEDFFNILQQDKQFLYGDQEYAKKIIGSAFRGGEGEELIEKLDDSSIQLDSLTVMDPKSIADFIRNEHPQTMALILSNLDAEKMAETMKLLPRKIYSDVISRIAKMDLVNPEFLENIEEVLSGEIQKKGSINLNQLGGTKYVADVVNIADTATEEELLDGVDEKDPMLAEEIRDLMFVFDDLVTLDQAAIQEIVKAVNSDLWKFALKTASEEVIEKIFKNMSERAGQMLKEDMEDMGPIKVSEVDAAQIKILEVVKTLETEGKITLKEDKGAFI